MPSRKPNKHPRSGELIQDGCDRLRDSAGNQELYASIAARLGVTETTLRRWRAGRRPGVEKIHLISKHLNIPKGELLAACGYRKGKPMPSAGPWRHSHNATQTYIYARRRLQTAKVEIDKANAIPVNFHAPEARLAAIASAWLEWESAQERVKQLDIEAFRLDAIAAGDEALLPVLDAAKNGDSDARAQVKELIHRSNEAYFEFRLSSSD